ncbi:MAG: DnaJ domain-containing protein [Gammaproteobacteria bacterium]|nr:DnaJ domain-containing protein [Gammaproteobacteria bacterium]MCP5425850.1 DnaJ domain-containing protein [Gammaproteobacteria bacterium]MCP5458549.1 DnaJ domain-containing protein [Gammaproteobacteria bacterium]
MEFKDYYQVLGVSRDATQDDIKRAYRKLARKYHPDVSKENDAEERFKEVGEAYEVLKDPEKRAAYDQFGKDWQAGQDFRPPPNWDSGFEFSGGGYTDARDFSDFFETLFGDRSSYHGGHKGAGIHAHGEDHHARLTVSLEDAYHGATRTITLTSANLDANGHLVSTPRSLNVKIPKGVTEGQRIRLAGQGSPGLGGGAHGDLYLEVALTAHPHFHAEQRDIYLELPVTPWEAALGASVTVPTLGGKVELKIPQGSQSGAKLRLKGRGLPGNPAGDQFVTLRIVIPAADTPEAKALYERMAEEMPLNPRTALEA